MSVRQATFNEPASGATLSANINAAVASFVYVGPDPPFAAGNIIVIDNEWLIVGAVNSATNTLSQLLRGFWPTIAGPAAPHLAGAVIGIVGPLAAYTLPNSTLPRILAAWNETLDPPAVEALKFELNAFRIETLRRNRIAAEAAGAAQVQAGQATLAAATAAEAAAASTEFPPIV